MQKTLIERVANRLVPKLAHADDPRSLAMDLALAAVEEMREPSYGMMALAGDASGDMARSYRSLVAAALREQEGLRDRWELTAP